MEIVKALQEKLNLSGTPLKIVQCDGQKSCEGIDL